MAEPTKSQQTIAVVRAVRKTDSLSFSSVNELPHCRAAKTQNRRRCGRHEHPIHPLEAVVAHTDEPNDQRQHRQQVPLHEKQVVALGIISTVADRQQQGAAGAYRGRLRWRGKAGENDGQHHEGQHRQRHEGDHELVENFPERRVALLLGKFRRKMRFPHRKPDDVDDVGGRQTEAGDERGKIQLDGRHAGGRGVKDEHHARRDEDAERTAGANHTCGELVVIASTEHRRHRQQAHENHDCADDPRCNSPQRTNHHGGDCQRARQTADGKLQGVEHSIENISSIYDVAHECKNGHGNKHIVRCHLERLLDQERKHAIGENFLAGQVVGVETEAHAHSHEREGDRKPEHDHENKNDQHRDADLRVSHDQVPL